LFLCNHLNWNWISIFPAWASFFTRRHMH
jgi:hypothetical protein